MESAMGNLHAALGLLTETYGELDNIKLLLGGGEGMTSDSVATELFEIAHGIKSGEFVAVDSYPEPALRDMVISL
jgi:hypothetical protein